MRLMSLLFPIIILSACDGSSIGTIADNDRALDAVISYCVEPLSKGENPEAGLIKLEKAEQSNGVYFATRYENIIVRTSSDQKKCEVMVESLGYSVATGFYGKKPFEKRIAGFKRDKNDLIKNGREKLAFLSQSGDVVSLNFQQINGASIWGVTAQADHPDEARFRPK